MKYIIFEDFSGKEAPILFPERILFEEMREQIPYSRVISAGYVYMGSQGLYCMGESKELMKKSRPEDRDIITKYFIESA